MPEIVENKLDADALHFYLSNRTLLSITFMTDLFIKRCSGLEDINKNLPLIITKVRSRAKKIFIFLEDKMGKNYWIILFHGMSGKIQIHKTPHSHIQFNISESWIGFNIWYVENVRRIGFCIGTDNIEVFQKHISDMGKPIIGYNEPGFEAIKFEEFAKNILK